MEIEVQPRRILYYPTINIPVGRWLRYAVLYWDEIGSIVPETFDDIGTYTPEVGYLIVEGVFQPYRPHGAINEIKNGASLKSELFEIIKSREFKKRLPPKNLRKFDSLVYREKVLDNVFERLEEAGLATGVNEHFYSFESNTYHIYMSLLAKYVSLSQNPFNRIHPGSDQPEYEDLIFKTTDENTGIPSFAMQLEKVLPVPAEDTALADILSFKRKHEGELSNFASIISDLQTAIQACTSSEQIVDTLHSFERNLANRVSDLQKSLRSAKINFALSTAGALLTYQHGEIIKGISDPITLKLPEFVGGIAILNCLTKAKEFIVPANDPVAYILHAQQEFA